MGTILRYSETGPGPTGRVMTIAFELNGQAFVALNGGPIYTFTPAVSFVVHCEMQNEIDAEDDQARHQRFAGSI
ncbi:MAG TPA: VOC family protein [Acetobacteraceae bacterium]|nr:VOC family protein [Acetobacteraceae bacterium]